MEIYFYCSYEHSRKGFFLTRLQGDTLVPADGISGTAAPEQVRDFFSYDRFRILWRDFCAEEGGILFPVPAMCFFGIRGLEGIMSDRRASVNLAVTAGWDEFFSVKHFVLSVLGDFDAFSLKLLQCLSVGGKCGYELNREAFERYGGEWFRKCAGTDMQAAGRLCVPETDPAGALLLRLQKTDNVPKTERDLLHFAVCSMDWAAAVSGFEHKWLWKLPPKCVVNQEEFAEHFCGRGAIRRVQQE